MTKQKPQPEEPRKIGPKFTRSVLPADFQIRRSPTPMADLLREAADLAAAADELPHEEPREPRRRRTDRTPVKTTGVKTPPVARPLDETGTKGAALPHLEIFLDEILPRFPAARQAILLRLYRWSEGREKSLIVSTPRLAAKTNMDEKSCRKHLHALVVEGFLVRSMDGGHDARFGGRDRQARGLLLHLSARALADLAD